MTEPDGERPRHYYPTEDSSTRRSLLSTSTVSWHRLPDLYHGLLASLYPILRPFLSQLLFPNKPFALQIPSQHLPGGPNRQSILIYTLSIIFRPLILCLISILFSSLDISWLFESVPLITLGKENTKGQWIHMLKLGCKVKKHFSGTANGISFIRHSSHAVEPQTSRVFRDLGGNLV